MPDNAATPNRDQIAALFADVLRAYEAGDLAPVANLFTQDARAEFSQYGDFASREAIVAGLSSVSVQGTPLRHFLTNQYIATDGQKAQQSAYFSCVITAGEGVTPSLGWYGGHFANSYEHTDDGWKITALHFELDWIHGTHPTLKGWPQPRNTLGWAPGAALPKTMSALDAPWRVFPEPTEPGPDEDQIIDAFTRYTWAVDQWDLDLLREILTEDIATDIVPFGPLQGRREFMSTLQLFRTGRVYLHHVIGDWRVEVDGDRAALRIFRLVPYNATPETLERNIYGATYSCTLRREGGVWKFDGISYTEGQLVELAE